MFQRKVTEAQGVQSFVCAGWVCAVVRSLEARFVLRGVYCSIKNTSPQSKKIDYP